MKNEPPVLLVLIPGFPADENDTVCLPAQQSLIRTIQKESPWLRIIILTFQYPYLKKEYTWFGVHVIAFGGKNKGGLSRLFLWSAIRKKIGQLQGQEKISAILSFWCGECAGVGKKAAKKWNIPFYCWLMGQDAKKENSYPRRIRIKPGELIAISDFTREEFARNHAIMPAHVIPLGAAIGIPPVVSIQRDIDLLGVGSLIPLKQYHLFIDVVAELKGHFPHLKAGICGKGPEENRLTNLIEQQGLKDAIVLFGEKPYHDVLELMLRSKILLHPSSYEGFSGVCLEALHAGAQVISFCKPMNHDIPNWHVVETKEQMKEKIISLLNQPIDLNSTHAYPVELAAKAVMKLIQEHSGHGEKLPS